MTTEMGRNSTTTNTTGSKCKEIIDDLLSPVPFIKSNCFYFTPFQNQNHKSKHAWNGFKSLSAQICFLLKSSMADYLAY